MKRRKRERRPVGAAGRAEERHRRSRSRWSGRISRAGAHATDPEAEGYAEQTTPRAMDHAGDARSTAGRRPLGRRGYRVTERQCIREAALSRSYLPLEHDDLAADL